MRSLREVAPCRCARRRRRPTGRRARSSGRTDWCSSGVQRDRLGTSSCGVPNTCEPDPYEYDIVAIELFVTSTESPGSARREHDVVAVGRPVGHQRRVAGDARRSEVRRHRRAAVGIVERQRAGRSSVTSAIACVSSGNGFPTGANVVYVPPIAFVVGVDDLVPRAAAGIVVHEADELLTAIAADAAAVADARAGARQRVTRGAVVLHDRRRRRLAERLAHDVALPTTPSNRSPTYRSCRARGRARPARSRTSWPASPARGPRR